MAITTIEYGTQDFVVDRQSINIDMGHQIDWATVPGTFINAATGKKEIPAGKAMKLVGTYAASGTDGRVIPIAIATDAAIGLLTTHATEDSPFSALTGYGMIVGGVVHENLLPDATGGPPKALAAALKTTLIGLGFTFRMFGGNRA